MTISKVSRFVIHIISYMISSLKNIYIFPLITDLQDTTLALDFRVTVLEENGRDGGNS